MLSSAPRQTAQIRPTATRIPTVCVVDPQAEDYQHWGGSADAHGIQLRTVANAEEALRFARNSAVDLWVVNTELPGITGFELCSMLKARSNSTPVYLVANEYTPDTERAAWQSRATLFACKGAHASLFDRWLSHGVSQQRRSV